MKPRLLDLFCGAGGAAMGYHRAGFEVVGVDIKPQPHFPFEFHLGDALTYPLDGFDAYHASPPCQAFSTIAKQISQIRQRLIQIDKPFVIENVKGAPLITPIQLCGSWFHLDFHRHRLFESNIAMMGTPCSHYWQKPRFRTYDKRRNGKLSTVVPVYGHNYQHKMELAKVAMGIDWMEDFELNEAIPPAYTEFIGKFLMQAVIRLDV